MPEVEDSAKVAGLEEPKADEDARGNSNAESENESTDEVPPKTQEASENAPKRADTPIDETIKKPLPGMPSWSYPDV